MKKVEDIFNYLNKIAPIENKEDWDNVGLLVGSMNNNVNNIILSLDATNDVIDDAIGNKCKLIITHHPLIFGSISNIIQDDILGNKLYKLISNNISVISMHTNLDKALLNKILIEKLGCYDCSQALDYMCIGYVEKTNMNNFVSSCINNLQNESLRYYDANRKVNKIACIGGAGSSGILDAYNLGCDTFVTADIKHHEFLLAKDLKINLIDADHFNTENVIIHELYKLLKEKFSEIDIKISKNNTQVVSYGKK